MSGLSQAELFHWLSNMVIQYCLLKKKGGGGLYLCVDYCTLNANMVIDAWPLPHINELLS